MTEKKIQKHVYLTQDHVQVLDDLMKNKVGINTYSEAIRYIIDVYSGQLAEEDSKVNQRKINAISKNVDILLEMVAGAFHEQNVKAIGRKEDTYVYQDAKRFVQENIQRSVTANSNYKKEKPLVEKEKSGLQNKPRKMFSRNFY